MVQLWYIRTLAKRFEFAGCKVIISLRTSTSAMSDVPAAAASASTTAPPPAPSTTAPAANAATDAASSAATPSAYEALAKDPSMPKMYPKPVTMLVIGMAGSGKTTLMQVTLWCLCI